MIALIILEVIIVLVPLIYALRTKNVHAKRIAMFAGVILLLTSALYLVFVYRHIVYEKNLNATTSKEVDLEGKYSIAVPADITVTKIARNVSNVPAYALTLPDASTIEIVLHPYVASTSSRPGTCTVSKDLDAGILAAPIFCERITLTDSLSAGNKKVNYGIITLDDSQSCTMNSPCPTNAPATTHTKVYVFAIADKSRNTIIEFFATVKSSRTTYIDFEGNAALLRNNIIPSLSVVQ